MEWLPPLPSRVGQPSAMPGWLIGVFAGLVQDFPRLQVALPNIIFDGRMAFYGSRRRVELVAFSGAHTRSDTVAYLSDDGIIFMYDRLWPHPVAQGARSQAQLSGGLGRPASC